MSAPIKFYYDLMSQPSRALYIFLKSTKIPFDEFPIALRKGKFHFLHDGTYVHLIYSILLFRLFLYFFKGIHLTDEFRDNVNRFKKVPAIVDNGYQLSESVAIFRYLASRNKIDDHWYPKNDKVRGRIDEYLEWQHVNTRQTCMQYFILSYLKPLTIGPSADDAHIIATAEKQMNSILDLFENLWLRPGCFISGTNQLSFADVLAACELEQPSINE